MKYLNILILILLTKVAAYSQVAPDTLKVMVYNVANYGSYGGSDCPTQTPAIKSDYLRTVLKYCNPDIIGLVKMAADDNTFYTDSIDPYVLDSVCNKCYSHASFTNKSGYYKADMLYFNSNKIGFVSTTTIYDKDPSISDINLHKLYYKSPTLSSTHDTIFLNIVLVHDQSGAKDSSARATEIGGAMSWLDAHIIRPGNYIFMGDFNVQGYTEKCYQDMINPTNNNVRFYDPVNELGDWTKHPSSYANLITQSTRVTDPGDCAATGGLDNRYDQILCTNPLLIGTDSLEYLDDSYTVIGQDGNHVNKAIVDAPANTSVPSKVLTALYNMSEHLPVTLKLVVDGSVSTAVKNITYSTGVKITFNSLVSDNLFINPIQNSGSYVSYLGSLSVFTIREKLISVQPFDFNHLSVLSLANLPQGMYIFSITQNYTPIFKGKFVKL